ncbi:MAG: hypothetical protein GY861_14290 [bacterium]|nr:hypothetical protein [bacterium]
MIEKTIFSKNKVWKKKVTPEEKAIRNKKVSQHIKKFWAEVSKEEADDIFRRRRKTLLAFYQTPRGREQKAYYGHAMAHGRKNMSEEQRRKKREAISRGHKRRSIEEVKKSGMKKSNAAKKQMAKTFETSVPREKNFCGVVREG